jgi:hypothetical protein
MKNFGAILFDEKTMKVIKDGTRYTIDGVTITLEEEMTPAQVHKFMEVIYPINDVFFAYSDVYKYYVVVCVGMGNDDSPFTKELEYVLEKVERVFKENNLAFF